MQIIHFKFKVPLAGIEPATRGLGNRCSILMSYRGDTCVFLKYRQSNEATNILSKNISENRAVSLSP